MKNIKLKKFYLLELAFAVVISVGIVSIFGFKYLIQVHRQSIKHSKMLIQTHQRMNFLEKRLNKCSEDHRSFKPASL